jgi:hypothetical protein
MPASTEPEEMNAAEENTNMAIGRAAFAYPNQNHLAHIQTHLDFALNPVLGSNPIIAPQMLPKALDHLKQHITLWYLQQMNEYVDKSLGKRMGQYNNSPMVHELDKLYALASQHTNLDVQQAFAKVGPAIQQLQQALQQFKPQPDMTGDDIVMLKTSMAETQRRQAKDQADIQLEQQRIQNEQLYRNRQQQIDIALDANDNLTDERIKTAELTRDSEALRHEQQKTALTALQGAQQNLGG